MKKLPNILPQLPSIPFEDLLTIPESVRAYISAQEEIIKQLLEMVLSLQEEIQELRNKLNIRICFKNTLTLQRDQCRESWSDGV